jgi:hypothetical protein
MLMAGESRDDRRPHMARGCDQRKELNMLTFVNNDSGQTVSWSVGQPRPSINTAGNFSCAADSAERKFIKDNFTGLPFRLNSAGAIIWRGDCARFIADNL